MIYSFNFIPILNINTPTFKKNYIKLVCVCCYKTFKLLKHKTRTKLTNKFDSSQKLEIALHVIFTVFYILFFNIKTNRKNLYKILKKITWYTM